VLTAAILDPGAISMLRAVAARAGNDETGKWFQRAVSDWLDAAGEESLDRLLGLLCSRRDSIGIAVGWTGSSAG